MKLLKPINIERLSLMKLVISDKYNLIKLPSESLFFYKLRKLKYRLIFKLIGND